MLLFLQINTFYEFDSATIRHPPHPYPPPKKTPVFYIKYSQLQSGLLVSFNCLYVINFHRYLIQKNLSIKFTTNFILENYLFYLYNNFELAFSCIFVFQIVVKLLSSSFVSYILSPIKSNAYFYLIT